MKTNYNIKTDTSNSILKLKNVKISLFTNNMRGVHCLKYLKSKKIKITNIIISKKNLDAKVINFLIRNNFKYTVILNLKNKKLLKILDQTDLGLVCGFPHIFKKNHFQKPKYGFINLHAGKLPKYRGGSPLNWQIINDEKYFGLSVIKINQGIDTGDIIIDRKFKLLKKYKIEDLHKIANKYFPVMLFDSIKKILSKKKLKKQNNNKASYFKQRKPEDSYIDPTLTTYKNLILLLRAMSLSYPSPYIFYKGRKILIKKIKISNIKKNFKTENVIYQSGKMFLKLRNKIVKIN